MGRRPKDHGFVFNYDKTELAWLAGYLEGEGCFQLRPSKRENIVYVYPAIQVQTTDHDVAVRAAEIMDAPQPWSLSSEHKPRWGVAISGWGITPLLRDLRPLMGERRRKAIDRILSAERKTAANKLNSGS